MPARDNGPFGTGDATGRLGEHAGVLAAALAAWASRDDTTAQPEIRRAANTAMDAIDAALAELYQLRARLVSEIRISDDATARRVDELLARPPAGETHQRKADR